MNNGGPAFPVGDQSLHPLLIGMSLRDWFAGMALGALRSQILTMMMTKEGDVSKAAEVAYRVADAMIAQRDKNPEPETKETTNGTG
jgi:hypothetical protein